MVRGTGFKHRKHIYKAGQSFATLVPGKSGVRVLPHKYQNEIDWESFSLDYEQLKQWLEANQYTMEGIF